MATSAILDRKAWSTRLATRGRRFVAVSALSTLMTQSLVWWLVGALYWHGTPANITAVCLSSIPAFMITRRWVWNCRQSKASLRRQAGVFWAMSLAGLVISTILATAMFMVYPHAWAVSLANLAGFGLLWFVRFFVLDHYLFAAQ